MLRARARRAAQMPRRPAPRSPRRPRRRCRSTRGCGRRWRPPWPHLITGPSSVSIATGRFRLDMHCASTERYARAATRTLCAHSSERQLAKRRCPMVRDSLIAMGAVLALGCGSNDGPMSWEDFQASVYQDPETGAFVYNQDELAETEADLR